MTYKEEEKPDVFIHLRINSRITTCLLDTGSPISLGNSSNFKKVNDSNAILKSVGGKRIIAKGEIDVEIENNAGEIINQKLIIVDNLGIDVVLGRDYINRIEQGKVLINIIQKMDIKNNVEENIFMVNVNAEIKKDEEEVENAIKNMNMKNINKEEEYEVKQLLLEYKNVFTLSKIPMKINSNVEHAIITEGNPIKLNPYRTSKIQDQIINEWVDMLLEYGLIRESCSPYAAPVLLRKEKDESWRFIIDYRKLNENTKKDSYPIPRNEDVFEELHGSTYFTSLDMASGYWQIPIKESDREKTAFVVKRGLYEWNVMPFGLTNAPGTFQRFTNDIIKRANLNECCKVKIDDILVHSGGNFRNHLNKLRLILETLKNNGCKMKLSKCKFFQEELVHLGHKLTLEGIKPDESKVEAVRKIPQPKTKKDIQSFLGMINFYNKFIPNYSKIASPLYELLKKDASFIFNDKCVKAFNDLKELLMNAPTLYYPNFDKEFILRTDASDEGLGACLSQKIDETNEAPISFHSRKLRDYEKNYPVSAKEAIALVFGAKKNNHYLYGNSNVIIETDHQPLQFISKWKDCNSTVSRWFMKLNEILSNATIRYIKGKENVVADALSRIFLIEEEFNLDMVKRLQKEDEMIKTIRDTLKNRRDINECLIDYPQLKKYSKNFMLINDILYIVKEKNNMIMIPKKAIIPLLMYVHENKVNGCHMGINRTYEEIKTRCYWINMIKDITKWIRSCEVCQLYKQSREKRKIDTLNIQIEGVPWKKINMDFVGPLKISLKGNRHILVIIDSFTKYAIAVPTKLNDAKTVAKVVSDNVIFAHGPPEKIHTDRGTHFDNRVLKEIYNILEIDHSITTAYNPQSDGLCERLNSTIGDLLSCLVDENCSDWDELIPRIIYRYNTTKHSNTGYTPYELMYARKPYIPLDLVLQGKREDIDINEYTKRWKDYYERSKQLEEKLNNKLNKNDDIQHKFKHGDLVLVKNFNRSEHDHSTKFIQKWKGPFRVKDDKHKVTVGLETLDGKNYDNVHSRYIIRYKKLENEIDNTKVNEIMKFRNEYNERNIGLEPEEMDNAQDEDYIENEIMETNHEGEEINNTSKISASETSDTIDTNEIKDLNDNDIEYESINDKTNEFNETNGMTMRKHKNQRKKLRRNHMNETKKLCKSSKKDNRKKQLKTNSQNNSTKPNRRKLIKNLEEPELKRSTRKTKPVTRYNSILFEHLDCDDTLSKPID